MKALILAAGYATRLFPLTLNKAKPLLMVGGKPIIEYIFDHIEDIEDLSEVYIVTNHKFYNDFVVWAKKFGFKRPVMVVDDKTLSNDDRLGAIGDINFVLEKEKINDSLLIIAGDNLFDFDIKPFVEFGKNKKSACVGVYDLPNKSLLCKYGVLSLSGDLKVVEFQEKPAAPKGSMISMGLYYFPKEKLGDFRQYIKEGNRPDQPGNYISWLSKKEDVYGFAFKQNWYDIGDQVSLKEARQKFRRV